MAVNLFISNFDGNPMATNLKTFFKKKSIPLLVTKILAFIFLAILVDQVFGSIFRHFYFRQTSGWEYRTKYSVEETKADILIFGASRAQQQYNPVYFEERLHQTCYNTGRDGEPVFYDYAILKGVLKRYTPKIVVLDMENFIFAQNQDSYDRLAILLPFYKGHPEMREVIALKSPYEKIKLQSQVYPYNSLLFKIAIGNLAYNKKRSEDIKGYVPLTRELEGTPRLNDYTKNTYPIDSVKLNYYNAFIDDCLKAGSKIYIVCGPYFFKAIGTDTSLLLARQIARQKNVPFFDFSKEQLFVTNPRLFDDSMHVNVNGSKIFTNQVIDSIIANR